MILYYKQQQKKDAKNFYACVNNKKNRLKQNLIELNDELNKTILPNVIINTEIKDLKLKIKKIKLQKKLDLLIAQNNTINQNTYLDSDKINLSNSLTNIKFDKDQDLNSDFDSVTQIAPYPDLIITKHQTNYMLNQIGIQIKLANKNLYDLEIIYEHYLKLKK